MCGYDIRMCVYVHTYICMYMYIFFYIYLIQQFSLKYVVFESTLLNFYAKQNKTQDIYLSIYGTNKSYLILCTMLPQTGPIHSKVAHGVTHGNCSCFFASV